MISAPWAEFLLTTLILAVGVGDDLRSRKIHNKLILILLPAALAGTILLKGFSGLLTLRPVRSTGFYNGRSFVHDKNHRRRRFKTIGYFCFYNLLDGCGPFTSLCPPLGFTAGNV